MIRASGERGPLTRSNRKLVNRNIQVRLTDALMVLRCASHPLWRMLARDMGG